MNSGPSLPWAWPFLDLVGKPSRLDTRIDALQTDVATVKVDVASVKERLAHIEGWIQGRFREGETQ